LSTFSQAAMETPRERKSSRRGSCARRHAG
jgi:hypothetical protein